MIKINLLPEKVRAAEKIKTSILLGAVATIAVAVVIGYLYVQQRAELQRIKSQVAEKRREMSSPALQKIVQDVKDFVEQQKNLDEQRAIVDKFREKQVFWIRVLDALPDVVPPQVWLTGFTQALDRGKTVLTIKAQASSPEDAAHFYTNLENYGLFKNINLEKMSSVVANGYPVIDFSVTVELEGA
jgi:Tfp pilus assembly protein PilN